MSQHESICQLNTVAAFFSFGSGPFLSKCFLRGQQAPQLKAQPCDLCGSREESQARAGEALVEFDLAAGVGVRVCAVPAAR